MEHRLGYAEDRALHAETITEEALGTIKSYVETNDKGSMPRTLDCTNPFLSGHGGAAPDEP